jgi:hypothetical protein
MRAGLVSVQGRESMTALYRPASGALESVPSILRLPCWLAILALVIAGSASARSDDSSSKTRSKSAAKPKSEKKEKPPAETPEEETLPSAEDGSFEADEDLTALVVPDGPLSKLKSSERMKFSQELRGMLLEGMGNPLDGLTIARRHFDAGRQLTNDEPRAAYAYGVVLYSHSEPKEALEQFRAAVRESKLPYLPALQAIAWVHAQRNDFARAFPAIDELARHIEESKGAWPTDHDRVHSAEWLGRMIGFLTGPGKPAGEESAIEKLAARLDQLLTGERKAAFEHGIKGAAVRHDELAAQAARPVNDVIAEMKQKRQEMLDASKAAEAAVKRLEDALRSIKQPHDKRLAELSRELREGATNSKKAHRDIAEAEEQVEELSTPRQYPQMTTTSRYRVRVPTVRMRSENAQEKKQRETQLAGAEQKLSQAKSSLDRAKQQIADAKSQRDEADLDYRRAMADKRPALAAARQKAHDLAARVSDFDPAGLTAEKLKSRVTALESYVPFDPSAEKNRLLATLKPAG